MVLSALAANAGDLRQDVDALRPADVLQIDAHGIDDRRARALQVLDRVREHVDDFGIRRIALVRLAEDADARALQAV